MSIELNMRFCTCFVPGSALLKIGKGKNNFCDQNGCRYYIYITRRAPLAIKNSNLT